jgi:ABC-type amino acid transport substrate-binding protein
MGFPAPDTVDDEHHRTNEEASVRRSIPLLAAGMIVLAVAMAGCGIGIPRDPEGTLDRVRGGELRAGVSPNGEFVTVEGNEPDGSEVAAIEEFAASLDADVTWTIGSEEALVRGLEAGEIDLVAGGLTDQTPWIDKAGVTRPYTETTDAQGKTLKVVMLVPLGENAFLSEVETFFTRRADAEAPR